MKTVEISYNPYKMETHMFIDNIDVCRNDIYEKFFNGKIKVYFGRAILLLQYCF